MKIGFTSDCPKSAKFSCTAKFRYRQTDSPVEVEMREDGTALITFAEPQRAITPGQAVVLYDGDVCLGGGTIDEVIKNNEKLTYVG